MFKQLVLFQLSVLDCFEGYSVRCFFLFKEREKSERDSQATVLLKKPAVTQFCYLFGSKGQSKVRRSPRGKTDYKYAFLLHKHNILLTWDRNTFPSPTLHPPLELCFFSFFLFFNGMTLLLFQGSGLFLNRSDPRWDLGAVAEWQTEKK